MVSARTALLSITRLCFPYSAAWALRPLALLLSLVFVSGPALAGHLPVAPGSVFTLYAYNGPGCGWWCKYPIDPSLPSGTVATYSTPSLNGAVPPAIVSKAQEWVRYWMQSETAFLLEYWQRLYDPAYCCNVFIVWTDWTDPTCFPEDTSSPAHNGHAPFGHWVGCETQATGRYYPGWNPPVDYNSGVIHIDLPYDVFAPCPAGTEFGGPNPTDCRPVCPAGTTRDAATGECKAGCRVDPIPPYTPDPYPALIEELSPRMQTALSCLRAAIGSQGGSSSLKSGYRPAPYNAHIQAVFDQRAKLRNRGPECAARKAELAIEEKRHDIGKKRPGDNSLHIIREAFDLKSSLSMDVTNGLAIVCNAFAPIPLDDRNHFEHTR